MFLSSSFATKMIVAVVVGGVIGIERELKSKSAGFRTLMLICVGATLFTSMSQLIGHNSSPDRIASNVVVGIGFIGAGIMFRGQNSVNGITTAASIWVTAALGVAIGGGYYMNALLGCFIVIIILFGFSYLDGPIDKLNQVRQYKIVYAYEEHNEHRYEKLIRRFKLKILHRGQSKQGNMIEGSWTVQGRETNHHAFIENILHDTEVTTFDF